MRQAMRGWALALVLILAMNGAAVALGEEWEPEALPFDEALLGVPKQADLPGEADIAQALEEAPAEADDGPFESNGTERNAAAKRLILNAESITLGAGEKFTLEGTLLDKAGQPVSGKLKFSSSKKKYATVSAGGVVKGVKKGSAKITVKGPKSTKAVCKVTVLNAPQSIRLSAKKEKLAYNAETGKGERVDLKVKLPGGTASAITWSGYDTAVVTVSESGRATAVGYGVTTVTATTFNGRSASFTLRVVPPEFAGTGNIAHRGGAGYWPENTLEAFKKCASTGATGVEMDVQSTLDGVQVIHHDDHFTAKGRTVVINRTNYEELKQLKPSLCTLDEALKVVSRKDMYLYLELKDSANAKACVKAVKQWGLEGRTMYISLAVSQLYALRKADKSARLGYIIRQTPGDVAALNARLKLTAVGQDIKYLTQDNVIRWQRMGLLVNAWTVNEKKDISRMLKWGVDSITGNYPKRVTSALK